MEMSHALFGIGRYSHLAVLHIGATLNLEDALPPVADRAGLLITPSAISSADTKIFVRQIQGLSDLVTPPNLVVLIFDIGDCQAADHASQFIEQATSSATHWLVVCANSGYPTNHSQVIPDGLFERHAHAIIILRSSPLRIPFPEQISRAVLALLPFAMKGVSRACLDFCDLADVLSVIQGYACMNISRIPATRLYDNSSNNPFLSLASDLPCAPTGAYLALGGRAEKLLDQLETASSALATAMETAWPFENSYSALVPSCFLDETLGEQLEIVTVLSLSYEHAPNQQQTNHQTGSNL